MPNSNADINLRNAEVCVVKAGSKRAQENNWRMQHVKYNPRNERTPEVLELCGRAGGCGVETTIDWWGDKSD